MSQPMRNPPTDISIWEQAYHDAWRHFQASILNVLDRLAWRSSSPGYRQTTIDQLDRLPIEVDNIRSTGQVMFEHVPGCRTVRGHHLTYFVVDFVRDCLNLDLRLNMLSWKLINRPDEDRTVYNRLLMILESIKDRIPD